MRKGWREAKYDLTLGLNLPDLDRVCGPIDEARTDIDGNGSVKGKAGCTLGNISQKDQRPMEQQENHLVQYQAVPQLMKVEHLKM